jgi:hypothetical protein
MPTRLGLDRIDHPEDTRGLAPELCVHVAQYKTQCIREMQRTTPSAGASTRANVSLIARRSERNCTAHTIVRRSGRADHESVFGGSITTC